MTEPEIRERYFVAIATSEYSGSFRNRNLPEVKQEVAEIRGWLVNEQLGDRRFKHVRGKLAENPSRNAIEAAFLKQRTRVNWQWNDAAVIYITGHGVDRPYGKDDLRNISSRHYLVLKNAKDEKDLNENGLVTTELFHWLADLDIEHLLVIVDACFAGKVTDELAGLAKKQWLVLPSAATGQRAQLRALTDAIGKIIADGKQYNIYDPYFRVGMFVRELNGILNPQGQSVEKIYKGDDHDEHVCLPNPAYQPGAWVETAATRRALALPKSALELHNRADGRPAAGDHPRWLFTGREELMRRLILAARTPGVTVVTGSAGCGKSTVLSRLVTLSDPGFRAGYADELNGVPDDMLPDPETVRLAVSARKMSNADLLAQMRHLLGAWSDKRASGNPVQAHFAALVEHIANEPGLFTIVIDALDEATEKSSLVKDVLAPLRRALPEEKLCLLIGVRSPGGDGVVGEVTADEEALANRVQAELGAERIAVDREPWWNPGDIDNFVRNILTHTAGSRYRGHADAITGISAAIREVAGTSYLMAQVAAQSLLGHGDIIAPDDPAWRATLDEGLPGVLRDDLQGSIPVLENRRRAVALLRAAAFARGNGLPWHSIWPKMATAVDAGDNASGTWGDPDVEWLLGSRLSAYLVTDRQDDLTVYRPLHDQLQKTLQYRWRELLAEPTARREEENVPPPEAAAEIEAVEERITSELSSLVIKRPSVAVDQPPPVYVRRHLAEHALAGGVLDTLPVPFLPYLDLARLRAAIGVYPGRGHLEENVPWLPVIRRVTHLWNWDHPASNAAAIEMWAALAGARLPQRRVGGSWRVLWAAGPPDNGSVLGRHDEQVWAAATADLSGTPVAVTGAKDGTVGTWNLSSGIPYREPVQMGGGAVNAVATARLPDGKTVAVAGCDDGTVRILDLRSGRVADDPLRGGTAKIVAVNAAALPGERVVVAAADEDGTIRTWDLTTRGPVGAALPTGKGLALGLATAKLGQQVLGLATGSDGGLQMWDLASGDPVGGRLPTPQHARRSSTNSDPGGRAIAAAVLDNKEIAITGYGDGLLLWDLRERRATGERLTGNDGTVRSLAVVQRENQVVAVTGGNVAAMSWDLAAGHPVGEPLTGHSGSVEAVAVIESADGTLAVSAGRDRTVRVWEIAGNRVAAAQPTAEQLKTVNAVATATWHGRPLAITGTGSFVQVRDLERGTLAVPPLTGHASAVVSVAAAELPDGEVLVVAGGWDGSILAWSVADGRLVGRAGYLHQGAIMSLATSWLPDGRVVVVTAGWQDGKVRVWDPYASAEACAPLQDRPGTIPTVVTATTADGRRLVVCGGSDGHVRIRDLHAHAGRASAPSWPSVDVDAGVPIASLAVTPPDGTLGLVVGGEDAGEGGTVRVLDMRDGTAIGAQWRAGRGAVTAVAAARLAGGRVAVFTGSMESLVRAWDISTGDAIGEALPTPGPVRAMSAYHAEPPSLLIGGAGAAVVQPQRDPR